MNKRLDFSNRTLIIIASVIVAAVILILIIRPTEREGDLTLKSYDGTTEITIEEVSREAADNNGRHMARCKVNRSKDFFGTHVKKNEYFVGSIDPNGFFIPASEKRETGYYILLKNNHYFCLIYENGYAILTELTAIVRIEGAIYYMPFPSDLELEYDQVNDLDFATLTGVGSFEELVEYYKRLKDDYYLVDNVNKTITVRLLKDGEPSDKTMVISLTENGISVGVEEEN